MLGTPGGRFGCHPLLAPRGHCLGCTSGSYTPAQAVPTCGAGCAGSFSSTVPFPSSNHRGIVPHFGCPALLLPPGYDGSVGAIGSMRGARAVAPELSRGGLSGFSFGFGEGFRFFLLVLVPEGYGEASCCLLTGRSVICLGSRVEPSLVCVPRGAEADRALRGKAGRHCGGALLRRADPARRPAKDVQRGALPRQVCSFLLCSFSAQLRCPNHPGRGLGMAQGRCWLQHTRFLRSSSPRWWVGEWQKCSATCGTSGLMKRTVLCIQSVGLDEQRALQQADCQHLSKPESTAPCHRDVPCPSQWAMGNWSEVRQSWGGRGSLQRWPERGRGATKMSSARSRQELSWLLKGIWGLHYSTCSHRKEFHGSERSR